MKLYIPNLKKEEGKFFPYAGSLELEIEGVENRPILNINLQAAYVTNRVLIKGEWQVELDGECNRCLERFGYLLNESFYEEFEQYGASQEEGHGNGVGIREGEMFFFKGDTLDLNEYFRQAFFMSQPLKLLCRADCQGLCPVCGKNKNKEVCNCLEDSVDPRWALLQKLKEKK